MIRATRECPDCDGKGYKILKRKGNLNKSRFEREECKRCEGTGRIRE